MSVIIFLFIGVLVGFSSVFLGIGGGILMVPGLNLFLDIPLKLAIFISLHCIFLNSIFNTYRFNKKDLVDWKTAKVVGPLSGAVAFFTLKLSQDWPELFLKKMLASVLCLVFIKLIHEIYISLFTNKKHGSTRQVSSDKKREEINSDGHTYKNTIILFILGAFSGFFSGSLGIGSGAILGPIFIVFYLVSNRKLSPTLNACMIFTTGFACLAYFLVNFSLYTVKNILPILLICSGSFAISFLFSNMQHRLPKHVRSGILALVLMFFVGKLIFSFS